MNRMMVMWSSRPKFKVIWLAPIFAIIALMSWALASPVGSSPDDDFHLASIWCAAGDKANECHTVADQSKRAVPGALVKSTCFAFKAEQSADCQGTIFDAKSGLVTTSRGNFQGLYPSLYYMTMNRFVSSSIEVSAVLMRIVNILLFVGVTTVLYVLLPTRRRPTLLCGLAISVVPLGMFLVASNNPSAWAIISAGTLWIALLGYFESSGAKRVGLAAIAALSTVLGAGARSDGAVYAVVAIVVVVLLTANLSRRWIMSTFFPLVLALMATILFLSAQQSSVAMSGIPGYVDVKHSPGWHYLLFWSVLNVPSLWAGVFGSGSWGLGWLDTLMPAIVWVGGLGCFAAFVFAGLVSLSTRKLLAAGIVLGSLWTIPTYVLVKSGTVVGNGVQPRYILPLIILLGGVALMQVGKVSIKLSKGQVVVLVSTLSVVNAIALHFNMRRYITGTDVTSWNLNTAAEWWWNIPVSPMMVWGVGSATFAAFLVIISMRNMFRPPVGMSHPVTALGESSCEEPRNRASAREGVAADGLAREVQRSP